MTKNKISKILIANRGEIAVRIISTAKRLGIKTVAIYSTADASSGAKFIEMADEAFHIPGYASKDTYLNVQKILEIIDISGADAVHPGYGFLSERASFVDELDKKGITFIGPSSKSMNAMGDKITAKTVAQKAKVNVVPGLICKIEGSEDLAKVASEIGFPLIIKAAMGGGGKGMKIVYKKEDLEDAAISAKNEARNSFGDDTIFIEKYIEKPRHIEIQVLADKFGNVVCLGERECSIQRFNQKVIEEAPSSFLDEKTRKKMYEQSISLVKACGYYSVGTVEYIVDQKKNFYFLEMNTRLQVEHPVTEFITGLDLVEQMIMVANGEKLQFNQDKIKLKGWAIEGRVCAEDPSKGFLPSIGRLSYYKEPEKKRSIRVDSGVDQGSEVSPYYDAMIAKVITYGDSRKEAIAEMRRALSQFQIEGIATNIDLIEAIMRNDRFISGDISTNFLKEEYPSGFKGADVDDDIQRSFIFAAAIIYKAHQDKYDSTTDKTNIQMDKAFDIDKDKLICVIDDLYELEYRNHTLTGIEVKISNEFIKIDHSYLPGHKLINISFDELTYSIKIKHLGYGKFILSYGGVVKKVVTYPYHVQHLLKYLPMDTGDEIQSEVPSPITGLVIKMKVSEGDVIVEGQDIFVVEAMKMENVIKSERSGTIDKVLKKEGENVSSGDIVVCFK